MVSNVTSLSGRGLRDWIVQRITAVFMGVYILVLAGFWVSHSEISFDTWSNFFSCPWIRILNSIMWLSLVLHAWIGLWTITTDYLKVLWLRLTIQMLVVFSLLGLFFWGILVFWGV